MDSELEAEMKEFRKKKLKVGIALIMKVSKHNYFIVMIFIRSFKVDRESQKKAELRAGPVFTAKGRIRPFLGNLGRFWPVFGSQRQYS